MIKAGLPTTARRNLFLHGGKSASGGGILFQWANGTLPTLTSSDRAIGWEGTTLKRWGGSSWSSIGGGTSSDVSLDDAYQDGANITVNGEAITMTGTHATNGILELRLTGSGTGNMIDIENSTTGSAGYDIIGTGDLWYVDSTGAALLVGITGCDTLVAAGDLSLDANSTGTIGIGGTSTGAVTITPALTCVASVVITGSADTDVFTITDGDILMSGGQLTIIETDTSTYAQTITTAGTGGGGLSITGDDITTGSLLYLDSDTGNTFSGDGGYINAINGSSSVFKVARYGATTILGNNGSAVLTITAGDVVVTSGSITITQDDDNAATLSVTNDTATTNDVIVFAGSGTFTGDSFMSVAPSGLTTGQAVAITCAALTTGEALYVTTSAITSGNAVYITNAGEAMTSGELLTVLNNESGNLATNTGNIVSFISTLEETAGTVTSNYDLALFQRTDKQSFAAQYDAQGSTVKIAKIHNKAAGTIVDAAINLEIVSTSTGSALILGDSVKITSVGVNERSLNIVNACTGKDAVLITASGVLTNGLAGLNVVCSGNLATGGAGIIITLSGSPSAEARAFEIDAQKDCRAVYIDTDSLAQDGFYMTHSGNLTAGFAVAHFTDAGAPAADNVYVLRASYTGAATQESVVIFADGGGKDVTGVLIDCDPVYSAANLSAQLTLFSDATGNLPILMQFYHDDSGAVSGEYAAKINFFGHDDADAKELYASIEVEMDDTSNANPDGILWIRGDLAGTLTHSAGFTGNKVMLGAAAATLTTGGAWDLTISTNSTASNEPRIVLTDGATGDITITAGGTSGEIIFASPTASTSEEDIDAADPSATTQISIIKTGGARAQTLNNHTVEGFVKELIMDTDGGNYVLTVTTGHTIATLSFTAVGDTAILKWIDGAWALMGSNGVTVA